MDAARDVYYKYVKFQCKIPHNLGYTNIKKVQILL
jgi:hypothetical protein